MIYLAGEPGDIWWNGEVKEVYLGADLVWKSGPTIEVHEVSRSGLVGDGTFHSFITLSPPPGEVWQVKIEGRISGANASRFPPYLRVGSERSELLRTETVAHSGEITSEDSRVGAITISGASSNAVAFVGTVTVGKP